MEADVLTLFIREGCHLCDEALELLQECSLSATCVDIDDDLELQLRYGLRIPVLQWAEQPQQLDWPFDQATLRSWLATHAGEMQP